MIRNMIENDIKRNKLLSAATVFFMAISAMLLALTVLLACGLTGAVDSLMDKAVVPDYMQMHAGEADLSEIARFAETNEEISAWQISGFLNLDNSRLVLGGICLADSTQDNGLCVQGERFDYLLDLENQKPQVLPGEVYVPVCYRTKYGLEVGDVMEIGVEQLRIAGFLRDGQMNSMMASSKRFLVNAADYDAIRASEAANHKVQEEYLIEFLLQDGADTNTLAAAYVSERLPANGPAITRPLIRTMNALSDGTMIFVLLLVSIVIVLVALLSIRFMLLLQMERDRKEVGMLKALGVSKKEIRRLYAAKYLLFSGCGAFLGLLGACLLKAPLARQLQELYGTDSGGFRSAVLALLAAAAVEGILLSSVLRSLKKTEKQSALEALFAPQKQKAERGQYFVIALVTAACTLLALVPQNLYDTMSDPQFVTYMGIGNGEIRMDVRQTQQMDAVTERIAAALEKDAQVERYVVLRTVTCPTVRPDGSSVNLSVELGDHGMFPVRYSQGGPPRAKTELALSAMNAQELGLSIGATLPLIVEGERVDYTICGIYSDITNGGKTAKALAADSSAPAAWSLLYVSLKESAEKETWMEQYRQMGADVTDMEEYVADTFGQTLQQLRLASAAALAVASLVIAVVVMLFMRLIVEKNRYSISLCKALGVVGTDLKRDYFTKGVRPVMAGICAGIVLGSLLGESLCGTALKSFGAESFRFVIAWEQVLVKIPAVLLGPAMPAILAGLAGIRSVKAYECCRGRE